MDLQALFLMGMYQLTAARDAPLPIVLAAIVAGLLAWGLAKWRYGATIHSLKRGLVRRDTELEKLRAQIPIGGEDVEIDTRASQSTQSTASSSDLSRALRLMTNAIDQADLALRSGDTREVDRALSSMGLALQKANRQFGLPVPGVAASATETLRLGKLYLEQVRPALRGGDDDEAHRRALAFLADIEQARAHPETPASRSTG